MFKEGNWLHPNKPLYNGDNLIRIDRTGKNGNGEDICEVTYFYDWEEKKFLFNKPDSGNLMFIDPIEGIL